MKMLAMIHSSDHVRKIRFCFSRYEIIGSSSSIDIDGSMTFEDKRCTVIETASQHAVDDVPQTNILHGVGFSKGGSENFPAK